MKPRRNPWAPALVLALALGGCGTPMMDNVLKVVMPDANYGPNPLNRDARRERCKDLEPNQPIKAWTDKGTYENQDCWEFETPEMGS